MSSENQNIAAAMDKVAETMKLTIKPINSEDEGPAGTQVLIRTTEQDKERWRKAAEASQMTLSAWIRKLLNDEAQKSLECSHPAEMQKIYPWSHMCLKCGKRLR